MKALTRWPRHPEPDDGEALSSWLTRVAAANCLSLTELLGNLSDPTFQTLGRESSDLDRDPPQEFLAEISGRTGRTAELLRAMTLAGLVPTVMDTLNPSDDPEVFSRYVHQHQILLTPRSIRSRATPGWQAWLPSTPLRRACPACVADTAPTPRLRLLGQLPLTLTCPDHGCYLESIDGVYESRVLWTDSQHDPRDAPPAMKAMDRRTHDALRTGVVTLPRREVTAAVWFRLVRTLLDELATFPTHAGRYKATLHAIWDRIGEPPRAGQMMWCTYEALRRPRQEKFLEAAAAAIDMIESGTIKPAGADGQLFLPPPPPPTARLSTTGGRWRRGLSEMSSEELWQEVRKNFVRAISLARKDPAAADELFRFLAWGPGGTDKARTILADLNITVPSPSHNNDSAPSRVIE
ncbi:TniQ family protein [Lacisediminihabitans changchengi]|uniref:TniQ family protein n=1 Tax=Lacisediminihabitans changchengi TaxID=2787634 RepID=A0A934SLA2_9MICO|nr:TniQ family protein [Lacisediminihabitans changchengi]MBK4347007.1 TniQ family protein [Lacisediminihabitans changchengi]MBK4347870.1 TniQ family protein [Lacisediminihabitans changchengi]